MTPEELAALPPHIATLVSLILVLGAGSIFVGIVELFEDWRDKRHYEKYGWSLRRGRSYTWAELFEAAKASGFRM